MVRKPLSWLSRLLGMLVICTMFQLGCFLPCASIVTFRSQKYYFTKKLGCLEGVAFSTLLHAVHDRLRVLACLVPF